MNARLFLTSGQTIDVRLRDATTVEDFVNAYSKEQRRPDGARNLYFNAPTDEDGSPESVCVFPGHITAVIEID